MRWSRLRGALHTAASSTRASERDFTRASGAHDGPRPVQRDDFAEAFDAAGLCLEYEPQTPGGTGICIGWKDWVMPAHRDFPAYGGQQPGVCIWLTGLSGAGKSTIAELLAGRLREGGHPVMLVDGDALRRGPSMGLGFSRHDRDVNVMRAAAMAREGVDRGDIVVCALISPYRVTREAARRLLGVDSFIEVFVDAPLTVCEARDPKGLYARYRRGEICGISGLDDPYEPPLTAELVLDTAASTASDTLHVALTYLAGWWASQRRQGPP